MSDYKIREITQEDEQKLGDIIRGCFMDYEATQKGTVFSDPVIDHLYDAFNHERAAYFVVKIDGEVMGGSGVQQLTGALPDVCELQKMYLKEEARGRGIGSALLNSCIEFARENGFRICYLESLPELKDALKMYERAGFEYIPERMGKTGYFGCSLFMALNL